MTRTDPRFSAVAKARYRRGNAGLVTILTGLLLASCHAGPNPANDPENAGYSLLYRLLSQQENVDKALWLHKVDPPAAAVIKEIAKTSGDARKQLEAFARADPGLQLKIQPLPKIEQETRAAIKSTETRVLLTSWGTTFRLRLLLTQNDSMEYASHLAEVLARDENNPERKRYLESLSEKFDDLNDKMVHLLSAPEPTK